MGELDQIRQRKTTQAAPTALRVPAEVDQLPVVRAVARTLAILDDFTLDEVADITLAVDQACAELIAAAPAGAELRCSFLHIESGLLISIGGCLGCGGVPNQHSFGWHVLATLTDSLSISHRPCDAQDTGQDMTIEFVKHRGAG